MVSVIILKLYCIPPVVINVEIVSSYRDYKWNLGIIVVKYINVLMPVCFPGASPNPAMYISTMLQWVFTSIYVKIMSRILIKFLCEGHFLHSSNLFITSALSATGGEFYGRSRNMTALPVIFSTTEHCSHGRQKLYFSLKFKLGVHVISHHINHDTTFSYCMHWPELYWKLL